MAIAVTAGLAACGGTTRIGGGSADTAFVGVALSLTRPEPDIFDAVQLAFDELNSKRPSSAPILALRAAPSTADSPVKVAMAFRDDPRVVAVIGHTESDATIAAAPVYADREHNGKHPMVAVTSATALAVTRVSPWIYRVNANVAEQGRSLARFVADSLGMRRSAVLYRNDAMGKGFNRAFTAEFAKSGGEVVEHDPFTETIDDFDAYGKRLVMKKVPSVVISGNAPQIRTMMRALHQAGGNPVVLGMNGPAASDTGDFKGLRYIMLFSAARPVSAEGVRFVAAFNAKTQHNPSHWGALGYDAARMIGLAVQEKGADRNGIREWFAAVGRGGTPFPGATGPITFDENRDPVNKKLLIGKVKQ
ncbi:MAG: branched-chain amino acid ABC transporter substrate-binding protein [bacterium]